MSDFLRLCDWSFLLLFIRKTLICIPAKRKKLKEVMNLTINRSLKVSCVFIFSLLFSSQKPHFSWFWAAQKEFSGSKVGCQMCMRSSSQVWRSAGQNLVLPVFVFRRKSMEAAFGPCNKELTQCEMRWMRLSQRVFAYLPTFALTCQLFVLALQKRCCKKWMTWRRCADGIKRAWKTLGCSTKLK